MKNVLQYFLDNLAACKKDECYQLHMRVLENLGSTETLPVILDHIDSKDKKTSVGAIKALKALPDAVFTEKRVRQKLQTVYFQMGQVRYDSSARTLALDTLLEHEPDSTFLSELLMSVSQRSAADLELATYTLQRLAEFAGNNPATGIKLKTILARDPTLNNYHVFAQNGLSTAFSRAIYCDASSNGSFR